MYIQQIQVYVQRPSLMGQYQVLDCTSFVCTGYQKQYTGYYVEVLSRKGKKYNKPFTPSDNKTKQRREINDRIRVIDARSFYELLTGNENALKELYLSIPDLTAEILQEELDITLDVSQIKNDDFIKK